MTGRDDDHKAHDARSSWVGGGWEGGGRRIPRTCRCVTRIPPDRPCRYSTLSVQSELNESILREEVAAHVKDRNDNARKLSFLAKKCVVLVSGVPLPGAVGGSVFILIVNHFLVLGWIPLWPLCHPCAWRARPVACVCLCVWAPTT